MTLPPSLWPGFNSKRFLVNPLGGSEMGVLQTTSSISEQSEYDGLRGSALTENGELNHYDVRFLPWSMKQ